MPMHETDVKLAAFLEKHGFRGDGDTFEGPDGEWIQYVSSERGEWAILVYRIDGDRDRLVEMDLYTLAHEGSP